MYNNNQCKIFSDTSNNNLQEVLQKRDPHRDINIFLNNINNYNKNKNSNKIVDIDISFIKSFKDHFILNIDSSKCLCNIIGNSSNFCDMNSNYPCLDKILSKGAVGEAYLIKIFKKDYVMKGISNINFFQPQLSFVSLKNIKNDHIKYNKSIEYNSKLFDKGDGKIFHGLLKIGLDSFTNQTCLHMILNQIFKKNIPNYVFQYDAFYCKTSDKYTGYNIMDIANQGDLTDVIRNPINKLTYIDIIDLFNQLLVPLSILKCNKYGFIHGDFKCNNIFVNKDNNKFTYLLADFDKSSIFWKGIRFYNSDAGALCTLPVKTYNGINVSQLNNEAFYKFNTIALGFDIQCYSMNSEIPMFTSYDFYTFIVSLLREPVVFDIIYNNNHNYNHFKQNILQVLFYNDDLAKFEQLIKDNNNYYLKKYISQIQYILDTNTIYKNKNIYNTLFVSKNLQDFNSKIQKLVPHSDYIKLMSNAKQNENLLNIINNYKTDLNKQNKGIGNINKILNPFKLKININKIYENLKIKFPTDVIDKKLCDIHLKSQDVYLVSNDNNICLNTCNQNICQTFDKNLKNSKCKNI